MSSPSMVPPSGSDPSKMSRCVSVCLLVSVVVTSCLATLLSVQLTSVPSSSPEKDEPCSRQMFGSSSAALQACRAQYSLQRNWYPDPIQGLFTYQTWNGMDGFWQNGVVLETMANCMHYLNNTRYRTVVVDSHRSLQDLLLAYGPQPSYDDMAWYGLAYSRIYQVTGLRKFLDISSSIFHWVWSGGWDTAVCGGGVWFDQSQAGKETIENVQMFQLGNRLARLTGQHQYREKAAQIWRWINKVGIINNRTGQVYDGISLTTCKTDTNTTFTYTAGTLIGGLVELFLLDRNTTHLLTAHTLTMSVIK